MEQYKSYVTFLAENNINQVVYNPDHIHAVDIMVNMFDQAKDLIKIYTGAFSGHISGHISGNKLYQEAMERMLDRGVKIKILCQERELKARPAPPIFNLLRYYSLVNPDLIEIKSHPFEVFDENNIEVHFSVTGNMFRIEEDIKDFKERCNFNDPKESVVWNDTFDRIFANPKSTIVQLYQKVDEPHFV